MIELELFYNKIQVAIRGEQAEYLKRVRSEPFEQDLPEVEEIRAEDYARLSFWQRWAYRRCLRKQLRRYRKALRAQNMPVDERLIRGYNAGIEISLGAVERTFKALEKERKK